MRIEAARYRGAGARRKCRVEAVDIEGEVHRIVTDDFFNPLHCGVDAVFIYPRSKQHIHAHKIAVPGADADLR